MKPYRGTGGRAVRPAALAAAMALGLWAGAGVPAAPEGRPKPATLPARDLVKAAAAEKLGWRLGMQAYTFRKYTFFEAVDKTAALGLKYIEMYPGQRVSKDLAARTGHSMDAKAVAAVKAKLAAAGVKLVCYGVVGLGRNEAEHRKVLAFAKTMGIETVNTETRPTPLLDKLCAEYGVNMALHNHPNSWPPEKVLSACEGRSKRVGACADTGHWMRAGHKPAETLRKLQGRIISLHFKDLNKTGRGAHDVPWGTGAGDVKAQLAELHRQGFKGVFSIEYEHKWTSSMPDIAKCIATFDTVAAELAAKSEKPPAK